MSHHFPLNYRSNTDKSPDSGELLDHFLDYVEQQKLSLYPAQEEAILSLFEGNNVILGTPTGSGKSLVALALHFWSLALGRKSYYTCPIKALVNEKFLALCRAFGPDQVGMSTGDATVNGDAPIICCTAEILSNIVLRQGESADVHDVVMDEFHYYADNERGVAWQVPLLIMNYSRFLLMSATLGDPEPFQKILTDRTAKPTTIVKTAERPVPLDFIYSQTPLTQSLVSLVEGGHAPVYLVSFTQREAAEYAQGLLSLDLSSKQEKKAISEELRGERFSSPYGKEIQKLLRHGIGIHHAGLLPKYRLLVEKLSQKGLLKVICGTDTLGVGVNVPIRTVLFTKLCKFDGRKTGVLSVRDFLQISGRAGRKGFDDKGTVVVQAPEHVIENLNLEAKAGTDPKKLRKIKRKQPPSRGYVHWDEQTFEKLRTSDPEPLRSNFTVSHGMLLNVLSRPVGGCKAMRQLISECHESDSNKAKLRQQGLRLFRSMFERNIVEFVDKPLGKGKTVRVNIELQDDFSIFQELAIWLLDTLPKLDKSADDYILDKLTLIESICENPRVILLKQLDKIKGERIGELKREGVEYDERMAIIEELTYPKPHADFVYATFNEFQSEHPWLETDNIKPKSIARDMFEQYMSFDEYIREYGLQRSEGILLRYLSEVYKVMSQTVPEAEQDEAYDEVATFIKTVICQVDSSLLDEWERIKDPKAALAKQEKAAEEADTKDITLSEHGFTVVVRNGVFRILRLLAFRNYTELLATLDQESGAHSWREAELVELMEPFYSDHEGVNLDKRARSRSFLKIIRAKEKWTVEQVITDIEEKDDWLLTLEVDIEKSRLKQDCVFSLVSIAEIGR